MPNANYIYTLRILLRYVRDPLLLTVSKEENERLKANTENPFFSSPGRKFFMCSTLDGKVYAINLRLLQSIHYLWDPTRYPLDKTRHDGPIVIHLLNRDEAIETRSDSPEEIYDFFSGLEVDDGESFKGFTDQDGELLVFQADEIAYSMGPEHLFAEGLSITLKEDGIAE